MDEQVSLDVLVLLFLQLRAKVFLRTLCDFLSSQAWNLSQKAAETFTEAESRQLRELYEVVSSDSSYIETLIMTVVISHEL